ncbi:MAG: hypothetical protein AAB685_00260 [Patescibacteria group bacterium]
METIIFPGFSLKNKNWSEDIQSGLGPTIPTIMVSWTHWETGNAESDWIEKETQRVVGLIKDKKVNILAKSIGTAIAMGVIEQKPELVNKVVLCGIPVLDFVLGDEKRYAVLKPFSADKVLCIQNNADNHGSYAEAKKFLHSSNPSLKIISKPRSDHEYPYLEEFMNFLR